MLVKCINSDGDKRLTKGEYYIVNRKIRWENSMTLVGMGGKFLINRFINENNKPIHKNDGFINKRYNPPASASFYGIGYAMPIPNKLKTLDRKIYKIQHVKTVHSRKDEKYINGKLYSTFYKNIKLDGFYGWFKAKNFLFFTKEEGEQLLREEKIEQITKKLNNEQL
jgi:hypothetical protein